MWIFDMTEDPAGKETKRGMNMPFVWSVGILVAVCVSMAALAVIWFVVSTG
jgi:hypothetical protein